MHMDAALNASEQGQAALALMKALGIEVQPRTLHKRQLMLELMERAGKAYPDVVEKISERDSEQLDSLLEIDPKAKPEEEELRLVDLMEDWYQT